MTEEQRGANRSELGGKKLQEQALVAAGELGIVPALPAAHYPASWRAANGDADLEAWRCAYAASPDRRSLLARRPNLLIGSARNVNAVRVRPQSSGRAGCPSGETPTTEPESGSGAP